MAQGNPEPHTGGKGPPWLQTDVKRAIKAAQDAGLADYRIEIGPDGTIAIVVGQAAPEPPPER